MTHCIVCGRTLKNPPINGMGPTCAARAGKAAPEVVERDLFGYDLDRAEAAARNRLQTVIESAAAEARSAIRSGFNVARMKFLWS